jgi:hypothetical protein
VAASVACFACAVFALLLAADVRGWGHAMRAGDVAAAAGATQVEWSADEALPFGLGRRLLGLDDDLAYRRAVLLFRRARTGVAVHDYGDAGAAARALAEAALARLARAGGSPERLSAIATLLGVLSLHDAELTQTPEPAQRAVLELQAAIRLDPANEQAKADLELAYRTDRGSGPAPGSQVKPGGPRAGGTLLLHGFGY